MTTDLTTCGRPVGLNRISEDDGVAIRPLHPHLPRAFSL